MSKLFVTNRANKGLEVVAGKYQFINGVMEVSDDEATKLEPILCRFYGCTVEDNPGDEYEEAKKTMDPALLASQTKAAEGVGAGAPIEAMIKNGEVAGDPNITGTLSGPGARLGDETALNTSADDDPDPKNVSNQSIANERTNHENTGGDGTRPITGPVSQSPDADTDDDEYDDR